MNDKTLVPWNDPLHELAFEFLNGLSPEQTEHSTALHALLIKVHNDALDSIAQHFNPKWVGHQIVAARKYPPP